MSNISNRDQVLSELMGKTDNLNWWWGWHHKAGWVVFFRNLRSTPFYRCVDWTCFKIEEPWETPFFTYAPNHLKTLDESLFLAEIQKLERYFSDAPTVWDYLNKEAESDHFAKVAALHAKRLFSEGKSAAGIRKPKSESRTSACWSCGQDLQAKEDFECMICGWLACRSCGACGCVKK